MNDTSFKPLAGLRGAQWDPARLPADLQATMHSLTTIDGANVSGVLYRRGGERAVCCLMHPRELLLTHYLVPELLEAGAAVWVQGSRAAGNDLRLEHELAVLDVDAGTSFLRQSGFDQIVLVGNSGGGGLYAYYAEQASLAPADRMAKTPAGRPVALSSLARGLLWRREMPMRQRACMTSSNLLASWPTEHCCPAACPPGQTPFRRGPSCWQDSRKRMIVSVTLDSG